mmetsp:Transcript_94163/g.285997  ORF Transcript_94163/g.285997 Transcript_94163/m.285997 type:complete len:355 (+) Transcript_94163:3-1067(+)
MASVATMLLYYVTYVLRLSSWLRLQTVGLAVIAAGATEAVMNLFYVRLFATGDGRSDANGTADRLLLRVAVAMRLVNAALTVAIMGLAPPSVPLLFAWAVASRVGLCSFSFFRISAQCWLADEDCVLGTGRGKRRQGTIFGALAMTQNFAGAAFVSLTFLGLGFSGLSTRNCEAWCRKDQQDGSADCVDRCFSRTIEEQPDSLRLYIRAVIGFWAPLCELLVAFHAYRFPIKGMRLRRLYLMVAEVRGESTGPKPAACAPQAASTICLRVEADEWSQASWLGRLEHTVALLRWWPAPRSHAVLLDLPAAGLSSDEPLKGRGCPEDCGGRLQPGPPESTVRSLSSSCPGRAGGGV